MPRASSGIGLADCLDERVARPSHPRGEESARGFVMRSDAELQSDVLNELKRDAWLRIKDLDVKVEGGVVTLSGSAETPCQRWRALQLARYVAGIAPVSDRMHIQEH